MLIEAAALRAAGRLPPVPFEIALADGRTLAFSRLLRVLPGKRVVGEAWLDGQRLLAKLFIAAPSQRHWSRERDGIEALLAAGVATPQLHWAGALLGGGHALLTEFVDQAENIADAWDFTAPVASVDARGAELLLAAMPLLARMHAAGLAQDDLHLGNFLYADGQCHVIDGDAVRVSSSGKALAAAEISANLAILFAQLPPRWDAKIPTFVAAYAAVPGALVPDAAMLLSDVLAVRQRRLRHFLGKTGRDCTQFAVARSIRQFSAVSRADQPALQTLLDTPDAALESGRRLKSGGTCTVADAQLGDFRVVIKRYNLKHWRHALSRAWRPSRAWHSWREAHRLAFYGIATPRPLAVIEERLGPLRGRAFLVTEYCPGGNLLDLLDADHLPEPAVASALLALFGELHALRITHGDLKASNLLWDAGRVVLIDLDAMCQHASPAGFARAWRRDRARFLRNWPAGSPLRVWLEQSLPEAQGAATA